jgi:hypothetical protein
MAADLSLFIFVPEPLAGIELATGKGGAVTVAGRKFFFPFSK